MSVTWWYKIVCILFILLTIPAASSACAGGNQGGPNAATEAMKQIPSDYWGYSYFDVAQVRNDSDLRPRYDNLRAWLSGLPGSLPTGINLDDITWIATAEETFIMGGNFDFSAVREKLDEAGKKISYRGTEIWTESAGGTTIALMNGLVLTGDIENVYECIDVTKGLGQSLYDNSDLRDVVGRLPKMAYASIAATLCEYSLTDDASCEAVAYGYDKIDAQTIGVTVVAKFPDAATASDSSSDFKSWATWAVGHNLEQVQAVQKGEFIKVTATFPISEMGTGQTLAPTPTPTPRPTYVHVYTPTPALTAAPAPTPTSTPTAAPPMTATPKPINWSSVSERINKLATDNGLTIQKVQQLTDDIVEIEGLGGCTDFAKAVDNEPEFILVGKPQLVPEGNCIIWFRVLPLN